MSNSWIVCGDSPHSLFKCMTSIFVWDIHARDPPACAVAAGRQLCQDGININVYIGNSVYCPPRKEEKMWGMSFPVAWGVSLGYSVTFYLVNANQLMIKLQIQAFDIASESDMGSV